MKQKLNELAQIYDRFAESTEGFRGNAACAKGCAFCCSDAGTIDITTLEGLRIREAVGRMLRSRQTDIKKVLAREMKKREAGTVAPCPFLGKNKGCMIYEARPFACRRVYSLHRCSSQKPPLLSHQYMELSRKALAQLQRLDENGYTGHISYVLHMLDAPRFLETYLAGDYKPEEVMAFGKTHRIGINKMVVESKANSLTNPVEDAKYMDVFH